ncbi:MAG: hypothetical protein ABS42_00395 [Bdellovibrio sp. SCN 50-8]|nr:MAG: hypothetical protein ABS42_00395 [Bdellovibrio sp. SCN 50-8]
MAAGVVLAALIGGILAGYFQNKAQKKDDFITGGNGTAMVEAMTTEEKPLATDLTEASPVVAEAESAEETPAEKQEREAFVKWRQAESAKLDATQVNEDLEIVSLNDRIKKLTKTEWKEIARSVLDVKGAANERVLSAYLMGQGALNSAQSEELLKEVLSKPLPNPGPHSPHSVEETEAMKEKSLRLLVIDELIQQARQDSRKRDQLIKAVDAITDPELRSLALRRLREEGL